MNPHACTHARARTRTHARTPARTRPPARTHTEFYWEAACIPAASILKQFVDGGAGSEAAGQLEPLIFPTAGPAAHLTVGERRRVRCACVCKPLPCGCVWYSRRCHVGACGMQGVAMCVRVVCKALPCGCVWYARRCHVGACGLRVWVRVCMRVHLHLCGDDDAFVCVAESTSTR